ncbi:exosortase/archaeosortase family protein [Candidatus Nomurabacteria bacterium]|nr:exosortase/archaeosortase family protein [Candidatus Nomurabacteria bacterium]
MKRLAIDLRSKLTRRVLSRCVFAVIVPFVLSFVHFWYTQRYYGYKLQISDGFVTYLPFVLLTAFFLFFFQKIQQHCKTEKTTYNIIFLLFGALFFFLPIKKIGFLENDVDLIFAEYIVLLIGSIFVLLGIFGRKFFVQFKTELSILLLILIPFVLAPILIDYFWEYSSLVTMYGLKLMFSLFHIEHTMRFETFNVQVQNFSAYIGPPCAGIHSLLAFTVLFTTLLLMGSQKGYRFITWRVVVSFIVGLLLVFVVNSIRVLLILLVGAYYDPEFAVNLFHNNIGAILLILFFIAYVSFVWKRMLDSRNAKQKTP